MKPIILILFVLLQSKIHGQSYSYEQIKDSLFVKLEKEVGPELVKFFEFEYPNKIMIGYKNWFGKYDTKWLKSGKEIKTNRLLEIYGEYVFKHPDWDSIDYVLSVMLTLDNRFNWMNSIEIANEIPDYIKEGGSCHWLSKKERQIITDTLNFEKKGFRRFSFIKYDNTLKKYFFVVRNIYYSEGGYYYYENYWLNLVSGEIERHFFDKAYVCTSM